MMIMHTHNRAWFGILASIFLGMIFVVAGMGKWFTGVADFQFVTPIDAFNIWLIWIELAVGIILVTGIFTKCAVSCSLLLITGFITNNILLIANGLGDEPCGCFGMGYKLTVVDSLYLDGVMVALAVTILVLYPGRFFNKRPWYWGK